MKRALILFSILMFAFISTSANADDCVDVELEAEVVSSEPYQILDIYFSLENCGTEPGVVTLTATLEYNGEEAGSAATELYMPAGEMLIKELELPLPEIVPPGEYTLCVTAELGNAVDTSCATITLDEDNNVTSFMLQSPTKTEEHSWGKIKSIYEHCCPK